MELPESNRAQTAVCLAEQGQCGGRCLASAPTEQSAEMKTGGHLGGGRGLAGGNQLLASLAASNDCGI